MDELLWASQNIVDGLFLFAIQRRSAKLHRQITRARVGAASRANWSKAFRQTHDGLSTKKNMTLSGPLFPHLSDSDSADIDVSKVA